MFQTWQLLLIIMLLVFCLLFTLTLSLQPQLLTITHKNQCIRSIVTTFISSHTCEKLSQDSKTQLALQMTNCLFQQMGKPVIKCESMTKCNVVGDQWNTFTTFFTHIDSLCHFYWDISKAQRTEQMIDALLHSAENTQKTLSKNNQNTRQILELQTALRLQIISSMASQQQMSQIISNSSVTINGLTSSISSSLNKIHADIDEHYAVVTRILSAVNQVLRHLDSLHLYLVAEVRSVQGVLFFVTLTIMTFIGCLVSSKVRIRKNECLILISVHFLMEFFFSTTIHSVIGIQPMRCISILILLLLVLSAKSPKNQIQQMIIKYLSSQRMERIIAKARQRQLRNQIKQQINQSP